MVVLAVGGCGATLASGASVAYARFLSVEHTAAETVVRVDRLEAQIDKRLDRIERTLNRILERIPRIPDLENRP